MILEIENIHFKVEDVDIFHKIYNYFIYVNFSQNLVNLTIQSQIRQINWDGGSIIYKLYATV